MIEWAESFAMCLAIPLLSTWLLNRDEPAVGSRLFWLRASMLAIACSTVMFAGHWIEWKVDGHTESSGLTFVALGVLQPALVAGILLLFRTQSREFRTAGALVFPTVAALPIILVSHYGWSQYVPTWLGCCPL
jgi:ABC-type Mn2+/Zn2+ transport system permease subunit